MNKQEFLTELARRLGSLPQAEVEKSLAFYAESIDDRVDEGMGEVEAVADLGDLDAIVESIMLELPLPLLAKAKITQSRKKSRDRTLWIVLAICGFPFWLPILITFGAVAIAVYVVIWSLVVVLFAILFSLAVAAVGGLVAGVAQLAFLGVSSGLMGIGLSIFCGGLFIMSLRGITWLTRKLIQLTVGVGRVIKARLLPKQEVA